MTFQPPRGTRDLPPEDARKREKILETCRRIYRKYGFEPLETPAFEDWKLLASKGGEAIKEEIYYFKDKSDRELGLRFDLTVPATRFVASNTDIPKPFRRYQIGMVWRYDKPGASRWREFCQADVDIFGSESVMADAEPVLAVCEVLRELGIDFTIRMNSRALVEDFFDKIGVKKADEVFRAIDKLDKIGRDGVKKELEALKLGKAAGKIVDFISATEEKKITAALGKKGKQSFEDLKKIEKMLAAAGYPTKIDMSLVRGLAYYTGPVFELTASSGPSIAGGGRYDALVKQFGGSDIPATGISLGVDRIAEMLPTEPTASKLFIVSASDSLLEDCAGIAQRLRGIGVPCEYDVMRRSISKQLSYVNSKKIPYALIVGEKELATGSYRLRDMRTGEERLVKEKELSGI